MRILITLCFVGLAINQAGADGIPMKNGHFIGAKTFTLQLTREQVGALEERRKPRQRLYWEPVVLTEEQTGIVKRHTNKRVKRIWIFEGNWSDCSCHAYNIASRIDKNLLEVPVSYLLTEQQIREQYPESTPEVRRAIPLSQ